MSSNRDPITVTLRIADGFTVGLHLHYYEYLSTNVVVERVKPCGAVAAFNDIHHSQDVRRIVVGDIILRRNGICDPEMMIREMRTSRILVIDFVHLDLTNILHLHTNCVKLRVADNNMLGLVLDIENHLGILPGALKVIRIEPFGAVWSWNFTRRF